jgi:hypothetical protein
MMWTRIRCSHCGTTFTTVSALLAHNHSSEHRAATRPADAEPPRAPTAGGLGRLDGADADARPGADRHRVRVRSIRRTDDAARPSEGGRQSRADGVARSYADVVEQLFTEYDGKHSLSVISRVAHDSRAAVTSESGRSPSPDLIYWAAVERLDAMPASAHPRRMGAGVRASRARRKVRRLRHAQEHETATR